MNLNLNLKQTHEKNCIPEDLKRYIKIYDLRENKNRYDDIVFTVNKNV